jgi:RNA polymerase sigma-70 factor (ECF subfamily)
VWQELFVLVYRYLRGRGLSHADAEDLAQETLLVTYQHLDGIEPGKLRAWVRTVARNKHVDWVRKQGRDVLVAEAPESTDSSDNPLAAALAVGDQEEARRLLSALSPADRHLLELRYLEDYSVEETAATLGRSVNTTKVGLFRARKRLQAQSEKGRS